MGVTTGISVYLANLSLPLPSSFAQPHKMTNSGELVLELVLRVSRFGPEHPKYEDPEMLLQEHRALSTFLRGHIEIDLLRMENARSAESGRLSLIYMSKELYAAAKWGTELTDLAALEPQAQATAAVSKSFAGKFERIRSLECTRLANLALCARVMHSTFDPISLFGRAVKDFEAIVRHAVLTPTHKLLRNDDALQAKIRALEVSDFSPQAPAPSCSRSAGGTCPPFSSPKAGGTRS